MTATVVSAPFMMNELLNVAKYRVAHDNYGNYFICSFNLMNCYKVSRTLRLNDCLEEVNKIMQNIPYDTTRLEKMALHVISGIIIAESFDNKFYKLNLDSMCG